MDLTSGRLNLNLPAPEPWDRKGLKSWHHELLQRMVLRPLDSLKDHAKALGVTETTIHQVTKSDLFLARLEELRGYKEQLMVMQIDAKMDEAISEGLNRVYEAVTDRDCDPNFALNAVVQIDKRRRGGGGQAEGGGPQVSISIGSSDLAEARRLIQVHAKAEQGGGNSEQLLEVLG